MEGNIPSARPGEGDAEAAEEDHQGIVGLHYAADLVLDVLEEVFDRGDQPSRETEPCVGDDEHEQDSIDHAKSGEQTEVGLVGG